MAYVKRRRQPTPDVGTDDQEELFALLEYLLATFCWMQEQLKPSIRDRHLVREAFRGAKRAIAAAKEILPETSWVQRRPKISLPIEFRRAEISIPDTKKSAQTGWEFDLLQLVTDELAMAKEAVEKAEQVLEIKTKLLNKITLQVHETSITWNNIRKITGNNSIEEI